MKKENLLKIAEVGIVSAVYVALVYFFAPISFLAFQFRLAEIVKPFVIYRKHLIWAMGIGTFVANLLFSPIIGPWDLIWNPVMDFIGGYLTWLLAKYISEYLAAGFYGVFVALAVAISLVFTLEIPFWAAFLPVLVSELILLVGGVPVVREIHKRVKFEGSN